MSYPNTLLSEFILTEGNSNNRRPAVFVRVQIGKRQICIRTKLAKTFSYNDLHNDKCPDKHQLNLVYLCVSYSDFIYLHAVAATIYSFQIRIVLHLSFMHFTIKYYLRIVKFTFFLFTRPNSKNLNSKLARPSHYKIRLSSYS